MSLNVSVAGGTNAGRRRPMQAGHAPTCVCSRCHPEAYASNKPKEA